jgi:F-type H+-transporting ATPase subunit delta
MQNPRLASRYAKSLLDLAVEQNSLEAALKDMQVLNAIFRQNRDFEVMLRSPVINADKKLSVINAVLKSQGISNITNAFMALLANKGREANLPEIASSFISQYNELKNIRAVRLTTATPMAEGVKSSIQSKIAGYMPKDTIELHTAVDADLIGGFVLEVEDKLYDASVKKSLNDIRSKIVDHSYESKL